MCAFNPPTSALPPPPPLTPLAAQADLRTFHPKLKVDVGRGPGIGVGPKLFVGLASAAPLPLTASQASTLGVEDSFDVELNPAQVMVVVVVGNDAVLGVVCLLPTLS